MPSANSWVDRKKRVSPTVSSSRTRGHQRALFAHGVPYDPSLTLAGDWEQDSGFALAGQLVEAGVTAIFAHNDLMALGVLDYCNAHGITVGKDLRLIGFDNRQISSVCRPRLSTVAPPLFEIGQTAAKELLNILTGTPPAHHTTMLKCTVIQRESTQR